MTRLKLALALTCVVLLGAGAIASDARSIARSVAALVFDPLIAVQSDVVQSNVAQSNVARNQGSRRARPAPRPQAALESREADAEPSMLPPQRFRKAKLTPATAPRVVVRKVGTCGPHTIAGLTSA